MIPGDSLLFLVVFGGSRCFLVFLNGSWLFVCGFWFFCVVFGGSL